MHVRSFLDHDRPFKAVTDLRSAQARQDFNYAGVYVARDGGAIEPAQAVQSLVEHLRRWREQMSPYGLVVLEVHNLHPATVRRGPDQTESAYYDAFHAFSGQQLVEASVFLMAAAEAGLFPEPGVSRLLPKTASFSRISLHRLLPQPYTVRHPLPGDLPQLVELDQRSQPEALHTPADELARRVKELPQMQMVLEVDGHIVAALYAQRIACIDVLHSSRHRELAKLHRADGRALQLLGLYVTPSMHGRGYSDALLQLMLLYAAALDDIDRVVGVTRCANYFQYRGEASIEQYIRTQRELGQWTDPMLHFHASHGAAIGDVLPQFRPADVDNDGAGIVIEYPLRESQEHRAAFAVAGDAPSAQLRTIGEVERTVRHIVSQVLGPERTSAYGPRIPLMEMGLGSLELLELRRLLGDATGRRLDATFFFSYGTPEAVIAYLGEQLHAGAAAAPAMDVTSVVPVAAPVAAQAADADDAIAIVGMACRLPGGIADPEQFWQALIEGRDLIGSLPPERAALRRSGAKPFRWEAGFLHAVDRFDAGFFRISPHEAEWLDPQQRLLLEASWEALESAAMAPSRLRGARCGVFVGQMGCEYADLLAQRGNAPVEAHFATGSACAVAAGRLSYFYDWQGPALSLDTACSSSLVAVHEACSSLQRGECALALAAGVNLLLDDKRFEAFERAGMLSPNGRCKTFDDTADGYVRSEGCAVVVLKRLADAQADGDRILAVIRGSAINQDGGSVSLTAPSQRAQQALIEEALAKAHVSPASIAYLEAHGTGTSLGDPIEVLAALQVLGRERPHDRPLLIGSAKSHLGHLEAAAGLAGLIKLVLCMQHDMLPAQLHFTTPNAHIPWDRLPARVVDHAQAWPAGSRRAGVSSFGFSGTNAHVVVEAYQPSSRQPTPVNGAVAIVLSARNNDRLLLRVAQLQRYLEQAAHDGRNVNLADLAYTLQVGREAMSARLALIVPTVEALQHKLAQVRAKEAPGEDVYGGEADGNQASPALFTADELLRQAMGGGANHGELHQLARSWVRGMSVDWASLYGDPKPQRLALPTYPFLATRYWVPETDNTASSEREWPGQEQVMPVSGQGETVARDDKPVAPVVQAKLAALLGVQPDEIELDVRLSELGLDSLAAIELRNWALQTYGVDIPQSTLLLGATARTVTDAITAMNMPSSDRSAAERAPRAAGATPRDDLDVAEMAREIQLEIAQPGQISSLRWRSSPAGTKLASDQIRMRVHYAALNFKDAMLSLGMLPGYAPVLGIEASGSIIELGSDVPRLYPRLQVGTRVIACTPGAQASAEAGSEQRSMMRTTVVLQASDTLPLPANVSDAEGAGFLSAYATAWYALHHVARVAAGETVLIHSAAGGVGIAAVQVARSLGADVIASAGSDAKRRYLRERWGLEQTIDSHRPEAFKAAIARLTDERGVDVVLNSLHGAGLRESLRCLAPAGRHVEIGKRDILQDAAIGLRALENNIAFHSVHLDGLAKTHPERVRALMCECAERLAQGQAAPLPMTIFPAEQVIDAFRSMASGDHIGKVMLSMVRHEATPTEQGAGHVALTAGGEVPEQDQPFAMGAELEQSGDHVGRQASDSSAGPAVKKKIAELLGFKQHEIPHDASLASLGLDSLAAIELRNWVKQRWNVDMSQSMLLTGATAEAVIQVIGAKDDAAVSTPMVAAAPIATVSSAAARPEAPGVDPAVTNVAMLPCVSRRHASSNAGERTIQLERCFSIQSLARLRQDLAETNQVIVVRGASAEHFCLGMDLDQVHFDDAAMSTALEHFAALTRQLSAAKMPVICVVEGQCRGGGMLFPSMASVVLANEDASFGFPEIRRGGLPGLVSVAAQQRLDRAACRKLMLTGDSFDAKTAATLGLVDFVGTKEAVEQELGRLLARFATIEPGLLETCQSQLPASDLDSALVMMGGLGLKAANRVRDARKLVSLLHDPDSGVVTIELDDAEHSNAIDWPIAEDLSRAIDAARQLAGLRAVVLQGCGPHFCVGANPYRFIAQLKALPVLVASRVTYDIYRAFTSIRELEVPVICVVHGKVIGGGFAAMLNADYRICTADAVFNYGNISRGVCPGLLLSESLERLVGKKWAFELYLNDYTMTAEEALAIGLVNEVHPTLEAAQAAAMAMARRIGAYPSAGVRATTALMRPGVDHARLARESLGMARCNIHGSAFTGDWKNEVRRPALAAPSPAQTPTAVMQPAQTQAAGQRAQAVGIIAMELYFPNHMVMQADMEDYQHCEGKYTIGLGQEAITFCGGEEDTVSMAMTAVQRLMDRYGIDWSSIGRLEVGTESPVDRSKSIKTYLMQLFEQRGCYDVEGVDTYNACYGGTSALFNTVAWCQSEAWDGRLGLVVCVDIAEFDEEQRFLTGAAAVAMLVGPDASLVMLPERASHMLHRWDFYKPVGWPKPFPLMDGRHSIDVYLSCLDGCQKKLAERTGQALIGEHDYFVFHCTSTYLIKRAFDRLVHNERPAASRIDKQNLFDAMVQPGTVLTRQLGSVYTASLYVCLYSLLLEQYEEIVGKVIGLYSYGSGASASFYRLRVARTPQIDRDIGVRLKQRRRHDPLAFEQLSKEYSDAYGRFGYVPADHHDRLAGVYYLQHVDDQGHRVYARHGDVLHEASEQPGKVQHEASAVLQ
ncbi:hypothetical protein GCM10027066_19050 [Dyella jejuensis]